MTGGEKKSVISDSTSPQLGIIIQLSDVINKLIAEL